MSSDARKRAEEALRVYDHECSARPKNCVTCTPRLSMALRALLAALAAAERDTAEVEGDRDAWRAQYVTVLAERDEARERAAEIPGLRLRLAQAEARASSLSRELLGAIQARDSYRASAELRVGMRREFEELLGCGDTMGDDAFERGLARLRGLLAAESRAERLEAALREIAVSHTGCDDRPQPSARERAELESDPWSGYQEPFCGACPRCVARAALGKEGK